MIAKQTRKSNSTLSPTLEAPLSMPKPKKKQKEGHTAPKNTKITSKKLLERGAVLQI